MVASRVECGGAKRSYLLLVPIMRDAGVQLNVSFEANRCILPSVLSFFSPELPHALFLSPLCLPISLTVWVVVVGAGYNQMHQASNSIAISSHRNLIAISLYTIVTVIPQSTCRSSFLSFALWRTVLLWAEVALEYPYLAVRACVRQGRFRRQCSSLQHLRRWKGVFEVQGETTDAWKRLR